MVETEEEDDIELVGGLTVERVCGVARSVLDDFTNKLNRYGVTLPILRAWSAIVKAFTAEQKRWTKEKARLQQLAHMANRDEPVAPQASKELADRLAAIRSNPTLTPEQKKAQSIDAFKDSIDMVLLFESVMKGLKEGKGEDRKLCAQMLGLFKEEEQRIVVPEISLNIIVRQEDAHLLNGSKIKLLE